LKICVASAILLGSRIGVAERLPIEVYGADEGLAQSVYCVVEGSRGLLWFGTNDGLFSYDGKRFEQWGVEQGLSRSVNEILEWQGKELWLATALGLVRLDHHQPVAPEQARFEVLRPGESSQRCNVRTLHRDPSGQLWIGTSDGLFVMSEDNEGYELIRVSLGSFFGGDQFELIEDIESANGGGLWIGTERYLLRLLPSGELVRYSFSPPAGVDGVRWLQRDSMGRLWFSTTLAIGRLANEPELPAQVSPGQTIDLDPSIARFYTTNDGLVDGRVLSMVEKRSGELYFGTIRGLCRLQEDSFVCYDRSSGLSDNEVTPVLEDTYANLWLVSRNGGAMRLPTTKMTSFSDADGLVSDQIRSLILGKGKSPYVISGDPNEIFVHGFDGQRFFAVRPRLPLGVKLGWGWNQIAFIDRHGAWWLATQDVLRYPEGLSLEQLAETEPSRIEIGSVFRIFEDSHGDVWISTFDGNLELRRWQRENGNVRGFPIHRWYNRGVATAFVEDPDGALWIGLYDGGLLRYREQRFEHFAPGQVVPPGFIYDLLLDAENRLWVATSRGGVARLDQLRSTQPVFEVYDTSDGLASNKAFALAEDHHGRLYIGSDRGVSRLDPKTGRVSHLSTTDGLAHSEVSSIVCDSQGVVWFGTAQGVSRLEPSADRELPPPRIWISRLRIAGVDHGVPDLNQQRPRPIRLAHHQSSIDVEAKAPYFAPGEQVRYQHRLNSTSSGWSSLTTESSLHLVGLSPGRYQLELRAVTLQGAVSEPVMLSFTIRPPFWRSWWFMTVMAVLVIALAITGHQLRLRRFLAIERLRTRIAADLHDDIGASLSQISILSEVARRDPDSERGRSILERVGTTARRLVDSTRDIVWSINPDYDDLGSLVVRVREFASDMFDGTGISWHLQADDTTTRLEPDQRRHLLLIVKEAMTNITRHANASNVEINIRTVKSNLLIEVNDDGCGFSPPDPAESRSGSGNGLFNMQFRASGINGDLHVDSQPGQGTRIRIEAPKG
jgi:signal transduction histidine kinase/ligand-binding sensor domain-containing protein